ncbi:MAG: DUF4270 family protein [Bacteroidia bacterium]|nr:DUF4270 family protein [Bacteroidia bacterium]
MIFRTRGWILTAIALLTIACNKPDNIGLNILPKSDLIDVFVIDSLTLVPYTVEVDSLIGSNTTVSMLGSYGDPVFGSVLAQHYAQFRLSKPNVDFSGVINIDSVILAVEIFDFYGNQNSMQTVNVYEMSQSMKIDSLYYTNQNFTAPTLRGRETIKINPDDSVLYDSTLIAPHIRVKLHNSFGDYLVGLPSEAYESSDNFVEHMKGLFITVDRIKNFNEGGLVMLDYNSGVSRLRIHYNDSMIFDFNVTSSSARHTSFEHNYSLSTPVGMQLANPSLGKERVYVHSTAGLKTRINIPYLSLLRKLGPVAINKAEIVLPIEQNSDAVYRPHERLALVASDSNGVDVTIPDILEASSYYGGEYDEIEKEFRFNIARHIQQVVRGTREDHGLVLVASGGVVNGYRTILKGENPTMGSGMKLNIIYSLVD